MLRRSYNWLMRRAASPEAPVWLALHAFAEGVFFPIPPDVMLIPMVLAHRDRAWRYGAICLGASVLGGTVGFGVGHFLTPVGVWLIRLTGGDAQQFLGWYKQWGIVLLAVPIPYKLTAIASGMGGINFAEFIVASIFIRGLRFFLVAGLIRAYGPPIQTFIEKRLALVVSGLALAAVGVVLVLRFAL